MSAYVRIAKGEVIAVGQFTGEAIASGTDAAQIIQRAIDATGAGEVLIESGEYQLARPLRLADGAQLRGRGRGTRLVAAGSTIADGKAPEETGSALIIGDRVKGAVVSDLALRGGVGATTGLILHGCADCHVRGAVVSSFADVGICSRAATLLSSIEGCTLAGNERAAIYLHELAEGEWGNFIPNLVSNCIIFGGGEGIVTVRAIVVNIVGTVVYQTGGPAFHLTRGSNSIVLSGCRTFQITGDCVVVENTHELNITGNIFCWHTENGIVLRNCDWGTITGNEIIDTGSYNPGTPDKQTRWDEVSGKYEEYDGIRMEGVRGYTVSSNTLFNWGVAPPMKYGIYEDGESFRNIISTNNVNYFSRAAVESRGKESVAKDTVSHAPEAYRAMGDKVQSFERELIQKLISELP